MISYPLCSRVSALCLLLAWSGGAVAQPAVVTVVPVPAPVFDPVSPPPPASTQMGAVAGGLTAKQAGRRAAASSRSIERLKVDIGIKERAVDRVVWASAPRISFNASYTRLSKVTAGSLGGEGFQVGTLVPPGEPIEDLDQLASFESTFPPPLQNSYNLGAHLQVPLSNYLFKLGNTLEAARGGPAVTKLETRVAEQAAAVEAKVDYYAWVQAKLNLLVSERAVEQAKRRLTDMQKLLQSGRIVSADLLQARAFAATTEFTAEQARSAVLLSEHKLRLVMHASPEEILQIGEDVLTVPVAAATSQDAYREALSQRPEIAALKTGLKAVGAEARVYRAGRLPVVEAFADVSYANPNQRIFPQQDKFQATWQVGIQASWSPSDMGIANVDADAAESRGVKMRSQLRELEEALQLEVLTATRGVTEARLNIHTSEQVQNAAGAAYEARATLYRNGRATSLEILQAETARINAEFGWVGAHIALHMAQVRLDHALGRELY